MFIRICIIISSFVGFLSTHARAQSVPCNQCPTLLQLCGDEPPTPPEKVIPPKPPSEIVTRRIVTVQGSNSDSPLALAKSRARSDARGAGHASCDDVMEYMENIEFFSESCTPTGDDLYRCTIQARAHCKKPAPNPALATWKAEKERIEAQRQADELPLYDYRMCVRAKGGTAESCQRTCGQPEPANVPATTSTPLNTPGEPGTQTINIGPSNSGQSNTSSEPTFAEKQAAKQALQAKQQAQINAGATALAGMVQGMDEESKQGLAKAALIAMGLGLAGLEIYGLSTGNDLAQGIAGGLIMAGTAGVTIWKTASALSTRDPAEGPYTWADSGYRFALGYERALVNYTGQEMDRSFLHGIRGSGSFRWPWVQADVESGVRFGTVKSGGKEYSHWGIPISVTLRMQPLNWGHLFSPFAGVGVSVYVQSNSATDSDNTQEFREPQDDSSTHWVIGNTFSLGRWLGSRGYQKQITSKEDPQRTIYVEPILSVGGMGTSLILRVGALTNMYVWSDPNELHEELQPGEVNSKATLAAALVIDDSGAGTGLQFGSCVRFKVQEGGHYCLPMFTGLYIDGHGNAYGDAHVLGIGYGLFYDTYQVAGFATAGMRIHGTEPPGGAFDYFDPSVAVGVQATIGRFGGSLQVLPLPELSTVLSAGVAF